MRIYDVHYMCTARRRRRRRADIKGPLHTWRFKWNSTDKKLSVTPGILVNISPPHFVRLLAQVQDFYNYVSSFCPLIIVLCNKFFPDIVLPALQLDFVKILS